MRPHSQDDGRPQSAFGRLSNELRIFPTPWHRYVHGLGLGPEPAGFDASKAQRLLETSNVLGRTTRSPYHALSHQLLQGIVSTCEAMSSSGGQAGQGGHAHLANAVAQLAQLTDPWQYGRACAMVTESLVKLGQLKAHQVTLHQSLKAALQRVEALRPTTDKDRYERLQLFGNLFVAAGQAGWTDLLAVPQQGGATYIDMALQGIDAISEAFYHERGAAMLFTALGIIGDGKYVCDGSENHMRRQLDAFEAQLAQMSAENAEAYHDPVHSFADVFMFPLSLTLNAIAVLGRPEYLTYQRNWIQQAVSQFHRLPASSRASQVMFYVSALSNLGVLDAHVPDMGALLSDCAEGFLQSTDGTQVDDYLRCTYLVHLAWQSGRWDVLPPRVWAILAASLPRVAGSDLYLQSAYGSSYMVAAYTLSALDTGGRFEALFSDEIDLLGAISRFKDDAKTTTMTLPRLDFALIDTALRLRPAAAGDTPLFRTVRLGQSG
jgi:hypothetical protein